VASRRSLLVETALGTALLVLGFAVGLFASRHYTEPAVFYQEEFGPAVMIAAGHGFVDTVPQPGSALTDFLSVRRPSLSTSDVTNVVVRPPDQFQEGTRYLLLAVGYVWRILGISWVNVSVVGAVLYGLSIVACYAICRIWLARPFAVAGALFICFSPLQLRAVPHIQFFPRDFFHLEIIPVLGLLVKGHFDIGGLQFGLLKDRHWYRHLGTDVPGDFVGIIDITESGTYTPIISNATRNDHDRNKFVLSRFGLVAVPSSQR
jgi:hypothetical protein